MSRGNTNAEDVEQYRSMLFSVAYNMLGTIADAEDMVQETFISWMKADKSHVESERYYLVRMISNKCLTHLKKLKLQRATYSGTWLPEPLISAADMEKAVDNKSKLSIGFLYLLEKLTPIERGVLILKEAFDYSHDEIAGIFGIEADTCRQHFSRAKKKLVLARTRFEADADAHREILMKFLEACMNQNIEGLISLLCEDVVAYGDGGGKAPAVAKPLAGRDKVTHLILDGFKKSGAISRVEMLGVNGLIGAALYVDPKKEKPNALLAVDLDENKRISGIYYISNPDKLSRIGSS